MKKRGRPPFKVNKSVCSKVRRLASQGYSKKQIARKLNIGYSTLMEKQATYPSFRQALELGCQDQVESMGETGSDLFDMAMSGKVEAMIRFLCARNPEYWSFDGHRRALRLAALAERNPDAVMVDRPVLVLEPCRVRVGLYIVALPRGLVVVRCSRACCLGSWRA